MRAYKLEIEMAGFVFVEDADEALEDAVESIAQMIMLKFHLNMWGTDE